MGLTPAGALSPLLRGAFVRSIVPNASLPHGCISFLVLSISRSHWKAGPGSTLLVCTW